MKTVFVNGCFDLFHIGHLHFLEWASRQGYRLYVAVASDEWCRRKGLTRPIISSSHRCQIVNALDCVYLAEVGCPLDKLEEWDEVDIYVKGATQDMEDRDATYARELEIEVLQAPKFSDMSTSSIIERIQQCR